MLGGSGQNGQYDWPATPKEWHFQSRKGGDEYTPGNHEHCYRHLLNPLFNDKEEFRDEKVHKFVDARRYSG